ncbi:hypothetical protein GXP75_10710 [Bacillus sp. HU-1818]|nr:hypothetical protein [Bacillus sp. HU-1818]
MELALALISVLIASFLAPFAPIPGHGSQRNTGKYLFAIGITRPSITVMNISLDPLTS